MSQITILQGDAIEQLRTLSEQSVHCCVTSPPYYGLRDYGTARWEGGDPKCDHIDSAKYAERQRQKKSMVALGERIDGSTRTREHDIAIGNNWQYRDTCGKCGAIRYDPQIGLEKTPEEYVQKLVEVFREVKRVLRDDGTLWLNLGDSYWANRAENGEMGGLGKTAKAGREQQGRAGCGKHQSIKPKDMIGIPWRVAFALQADGWYLRSDIIWNKPNPMPESVTDRPTKSHEYIFLLTKNARYFYDADAIREAATTIEERPFGCERARGYNGKLNLDPNAPAQFKHKNLMEGGQPPQTMHLNRVLKQDLTGNPTYTGFNERWKASKETGHTGDGHSGYVNSDGSPRGDGITRNARTVWTITTQARPEAHFATFPDEIPRRCIKAGTSEYGCCPVCGAPWERIIKEGNLVSSSERKDVWQTSGNGETSCTKPGHAVALFRREHTTTGWRPSCQPPSSGREQPPQPLGGGCNGDQEPLNPVPCVVLDPFGGSGTTGEMARELKRDCILIELNPEYIKIMRERLRLNEQLGV